MATLIAPMDVRFSTPMMEFFIVESLSLDSTFILGLNNTFILGNNHVVLKLDSSCSEIARATVINKGPEITQYKAGDRVLVRKSDGLHIDSLGIIYHEADIFGKFIEETGYYLSYRDNTFIPGNEQVVLKLDMNLFEIVQATIANKGPKVTQYEVGDQVLVRKSGGIQLESCENYYENYNIYHEADILAKFIVEPNKHSVTILGNNFLPGNDQVELKPDISLLKFVRATVTSKGPKVTQYEVGDRVLVRKSDDGLFWFNIYHEAGIFGKFIEEPKHLLPFLDITFLPGNDQVLLKLDMSLLKIVQATVVKKGPKVTQYEVGDRVLVRKSGEFQLEHPDYDIFHEADIFGKFIEEPSHLLSCLDNTFIPGNDQVVLIFDIFDMSLSKIARATVANKGSKVTQYEVGDRVLVRKSGEFQLELRDYDIYHEADIFGKLIEGPFRKFIKETVGSIYEQFIKETVGFVYEQFIKETVGLVYEQIFAS